MKSGAALVQGERVAARVLLQTTAEGSLTLAVTPSSGSMNVLAPK
jgi:hypothetical protein